jgi:hypothetical protein
MLAMLTLALGGPLGDTTTMAGTSDAASTSTASSTGWVMGLVRAPHGPPARSSTVPQRSDTRSSSCRLAFLSLETKGQYMLNLYSH